MYSRMKQASNLTLTFLPCTMRRTEESGPSHAIRTDTRRRGTTTATGCPVASARPTKPERREREEQGGLGLGLGASEMRWLGRLMAAAGIAAAAAMASSISFSDG